jgi:hypothetical protein
LAGRQYGKIFSAPPCLGGLFLQKSAARPSPKAATTFSVETCGFVLQQIPQICVPLLRCSLLVESCSFVEYTRKEDGFLQNDKKEVKGQPTTNNGHRTTISPCSTFRFNTPPGS